MDRGRRSRADFDLEWAGDLEAVEFRDLNIPFDGGAVIIGVAPAGRNDGIRISMTSGRGMAPNSSLVY